MTMNVIFITKASNMDNITIIAIRRYEEVTNSSNFFSLKILTINDV